MDEVLTNVGHAYDGRSGLFTCRQPGTYVFLATIMVD